MSRQIVLLRVIECPASPEGKEKMEVWGSLQGTVCGGHRLGEALRPKGVWSIYRDVLWY